MTTIDHDKLNANHKLFGEISSSFRDAKTQAALRIAGDVFDTPAFMEMPDQVQEELIAQYGHRSIRLSGALQG